MKYRIILQSDTYLVQAFKMREINCEWITLEVFSDKSEALYFYNSLVEGSMTEDGEPILIQS